MGCPSEFVLAPTGLCVVSCTDSYTLVMNGVQPTCVLKGANGGTVASFPLTSVSPVVGVRSSTSYTTTGWPLAFGNAYNDFVRDKALAAASVDSISKKDAAFAALQTAENARDGTQPLEQAYEKARVAYYTLTSGDQWVQQEKTRIGSAEAQPVIDGLISQYRALQTKRAQQQSTMDVINGLKDKVLSVKDDLSFSVNTFQKQVDAIKNQINIDKKNQVDAVKATASWVESVLNWLIAIATIVCIVLLVRRLTRSGSGRYWNSLDGEVRFLRAQNGLFQSYFAPKAAARAAAPAAAAAAPAAK